jgi:dTDP-4-dehydrorhamnose reductase
MRSASELSAADTDGLAPVGRPLLIVGAGGMLGTALARVAEQRGYAARPYLETELDITDRAAVEEIIGRFATAEPEAGIAGAVVNAAAYTDVERAEEDSERAYLINEQAAGWLAAATHECGLAFVHVSTDFIFDGAKNGPYLENDEPRPLSVYGASKLAGENTVLSGHPDALVIRTAWTYGLGSTNFPLKILQRARTLQESMVPPVLRVVIDEIGSPTYSVDLAEGLLALLSLGAKGLFHLTGGGSCSRYELALETLRLSGIDVPDDIQVEPVASASFPTKAARPLKAVLNCTKAADLGVRLPRWQDGLARFLAEL